MATLRNFRPNPREREGESRDSTARASWFNCAHWWDGMYVRVSNSHTFIHQVIHTICSHMYELLDVFRTRSKYMHQEIYSLDLIHAGFNTPYPPRGLYCTDLLFIYKLTSIAPIILSDTCNIYRHNFKTFNYTIGYEPKTLKFWHLILLNPIRSRRTLRRLS